MTSHWNPTLLAIGVRETPAYSPAIDFYVANTMRQAMATIRLINFDLVLVGLEDPELDVWELMRRVLTAWPRQRWILASSLVTPQVEVRARSLGALMVLGVLPDELWLEDLIASLRRRDVVQRSSGALSGRASVATASVRPETNVIG
jgi:hypothetical protein